MKYAARADENQPDIVDALRKYGFSVRSTHREGQGFPDLVIAKAGRAALAECKMPGEGLNLLQEAFRRGWHSPIYILSSVEDVARLNDAWRLQ